MTEPVRVTVTVTVTDDPNNPLIVSPLKVVLNPGDFLVWEFQNVPSDCVQGILFGSFGSESGEPESAFGPFQALRLAGNTVIGRGNLGEDGKPPYRYKAQLLDVKGIRAESKEIGEVVNQVSERDASPMAVISCHSVAGTSEFTIDDVDPLKLFVGDTAVWYVSGLPTNFFVSFLFTLPPDNDSKIGPFESLQFSRSIDGEGAVAVQVIGVSFSPGTLESISYKIDARDSSGLVVTPPHDPQIDNLGQPPGSGQ